jgi:hypothetical protein
MNETISKGSDVLYYELWLEHCVVISLMRTHCEET